MAIKRVSPAWWHSPVNPALGKQRQSLLSPADTVSQRGAVVKMGVVCKSNDPQECYTNSSSSELFYRQNCQATNIN